MTHDLFLSYNSRDRDAVARIRRQLRDQYGISTFLDRDNLTPGRPWFDELQAALGEVRAVAVFFGQHNLGTWQKREMTLALDRQAQAEKLDRNFLVIPVVLPGADLEKAPALLLLNTFIDLRSGIDDAAIASLAHAVQSQVPEAESRPATDLCPFRALRSFREVDAPLFFGREVFVEALLNKVKQHFLVAVVGPSGSGKSSVVQAGLLPLLHRELPPRPAWEAIMFTPGENPLKQLAAALIPLWETEMSETDRLLEVTKLSKALHDGEITPATAIANTLNKLRDADRLLIVVDQLEELFTLTPERDRLPFVNWLLAASEAATVTIALTLRADFYGQTIGLSRQLSDRIQAGLVNIGSMTRQELRTAIEEPAVKVGLRFESGLIDRILDQVENQPESLPLLEFALTQLWKQRQGQTLTNDKYTEIGEVKKAISTQAEEQFSKLSPAQQQAAMRFLTRLVRLASAGEEGTDTRQRVVISREDRDWSSIAERFIAARLLVTRRNEVTGEETIEVAHEALIRNWPRLKELLDRNREFYLWRQQLGLRLDEWKRLDRDSGALLRGKLLQEARRWLKERSAEVEAEERAFIDQSETAAGRWRRWARVAVMAAAVSLVAGLGWWAWVRSDRYQINLIRSKAAQLTVNASADAVNNWVRALVLVGFTDDATSTATAIRDQGQRSVAFDALKEALVLTGKADKANTMAQITNGAGEESAIARDPIVVMRALKEAYAKSTDFIDAMLNVRGLSRNTSKFSREADNMLRMMTLDRDLQTDIVTAIMAEAGRIKDPEQAAALAREIKTESLDDPLFSVKIAILIQSGKSKEAIDIARSFDKPEHRAFALASVAAAMLKLNRRNEGRPILSEIRTNVLAVDGVVSRTALITTLAHILIEAGENEFAAQIIEDGYKLAHSIKDPGDRAIALGDLVTILGRVGKMDLANQVAEELLGIVSPDNPESSFQRGTLVRVIPAFVETNKAEAVLAVIRKLSEDSRTLPFLVVAGLLIDRGTPDSARKILQEARVDALLIEDPEERSTALVRCGELLDRTGDTVPAATATRQALEAAQKINAPLQRSLLLGEVAVLFADLGKTEDALAAAAMVSDEQISSHACSNITKGIANHRQYRQAREVAESCSRPDDKLAAHSEILIAYAREHNPDLSKKLKDDETAKRNARRASLVPGLQ